MNIRRSAWHFRVYRFLISMWSEGPDVLKGRRTSHEPRDLCHYFWTLSLLALTFPIWVVLAVFITVIFAIVIVILAVWNYGFYPPLHRVTVKLQEAEAKRPPKPAVEKQPGLLRTYMAARKKKLCPMITIVDE